MEARNEYREEEKNQSTPLDPKGNMEGHGDVRWEHQAPCNLSENPEVLCLRASGEVLRNELGKQDGFGERRISMLLCPLKVMCVKLNNT